MASLSITVDVGGLDATVAVLDRLRALDPGRLMTNIAAIGESQTRRRITSEKTAPDGTAWPPNVEGTPTLKRTGRNLLDSVSSDATADQARWGADWEFASIHQEGAVIRAKDAKALMFTVQGKTVAVGAVTIPARPFVGLSNANRREIERLVTDHLGRLLGGAS